MHERSLARTMLPAEPAFIWRSGGYGGRMTVYVVPADTWQYDEAQEGDVLLRPDGDVVVLGLVTESGAQWLGPVPEGALEISPVQQPTEAEGLTEAELQPLLAALAERGA